MDKLLYGIPEVCSLTGLGRSKVYELIEAGRIASVKVDKRRLVTASALARFVEELEQREVA